jgi:hypothetical protein
MNSKLEPGVVVHTCNPSTHSEARGRRIMIQTSRTSCATKGNPMSKKKKKKKQEKTN